MKPTGKPGAQRFAAVAAITASESPIGVAMVDILPICGGTAKALSRLLAHMVAGGQLFSIGRHRDMRYFPTAEKRDAAGPAYAEHMAKLTAQRKQNRIDNRMQTAERRRAKVSRKVGRPAGKSGTVISKVLEIVLRCRDPLGVPPAGFAEIVGKKVTVIKSLEQLVDRQQVFVWGYRNWRRFFASAEARDAAAPLLQQMQLEATKKQRADYSAARWIAKKAAMPPKVKPVKSPKEPKQRVAAQPKAEKGSKPLAKAAQPAPVVIKKPRVNFKDMPAIVPETVKVTKCPGYTPRTFAPPPFFKGEYQREWAELRGGHR